MPKGGPIQIQESVSKAFLLKGTVLGSEDNPPASRAAGNGT